jgi:hypothetical protein
LWQNAAIKSIDVLVIAPEIKKPGTKIDSRSFHHKLSSEPWADRIPYRLTNENQIVQTGGLGDINPADAIQVAMQ